MLNQHEETVIWHFWQVILPYFKSEFVLIMALILPAAEYNRLPKYDADSGMLNTCFL